MRHGGSLAGFAALALGALIAESLIHDPPQRTTDPARITALYRDVLGEDVPRPTGSDADRRAVQRIAATLTGYGYAPEIQRGLACAPNGMCAFVENVIARRAGTSTGTIVLAAHHDTVPASPGGYDDGAGVVAQLEIARQLAESPPLPRAIVLLFSDGEELGLNGARLFVAEHPYAKDVRAMIAVEAMGGPTTIYRGGDTLGFVRFCRAHGLPPPLTTSALDYLDPHPGFDAQVFEERGIRNLILTGVSDGVRYHSPLDRGDTADATLVAARADVALAYARALATHDLPDADEPSASFLAPLVGLVAWPLAATRWLGPLAALLTLVLCAWRAPTARFALEIVLLGALGAAATAGAIATCMVARKAGMLTGMFITAPLLLRTGLFALAAGGLALLVRRFDPRAALSALAIAGGAAAVLRLSSGAHLVLIPALAGALIVAVARAPRSGGVVALLALGVLTGQVEALSWPLNMGPTYVFSAAVAAAAAVVWVTVAHASTRAALATVALGVAAIGGAAMAARLGDGPIERVSVRLHTDLDRGAARWLVLDTLPPAIARAADFSRDPLPLPWWTQSPPAVATATIAPVARGPQLTGTSSRTADGRIFRGILRSPDGRWSIAIALPPDAPVDTVRVAGQPVALLPGVVKRSQGHRVITVFGARTASVAIEADIRGEHPIEVELIELDATLPREARGLGRRRTKHQVPVHNGDAWMITRHTTI